MLKERLQGVRENAPLIHNITNYVTVNDCANALLACGGSPIMADDISEAAEITSLCGGLTINIGTLNQFTIAAMLAAGKKANKLGHPVVLDPVGAGASAFRTATAMQLLKEIRFTAIRGNISEIKTLASGSGSTKGVDANIADAVTPDNLAQTVTFAKAFSKETSAIIMITGAIDIITDQHTAYCVYNGNPMMSKITGTGCMLSAITAAYVTANPNALLEACAAAVCVMGLCGDRAFARLTAVDGNATYRNYIIDEIFHLDAKTLESEAHYEMR